MSITVLLSLGGNMGDRRATMDAAVAAIATLPGTTVTARSSAYRTAPDGPVAQDWFVNLAVSIRTDMAIAALATACRETEAALGRDRNKEIPWGPRPIDIDVVAWGNGAAPDIMEPRRGALDTRPFVMIPLAEIAPNIRIGERTIGAIAADTDSAGVIRLDWAAPAG